MKPQFYLLGAAVAVLSLGACSKDEARPEPSNEGYAFSFTVAEDDTRTTLATSDILRWVYTDRVGIYTVGENLNPNTLTVADVNQSPVEFIGVLKRPVTPGDRFYAYYPYDAAQAADPAAVTLSIPVAQKQSKADVYNGESNPLVALPMEFPGVQDSYACRMSSVRFKQLGAIIELQLYASDEAIRNEMIRSITFEADAPLAGEFPFDLTAVTAKGELNISGYESAVASTVLEEPAAIPSSRDNAARVYLTIAPGEYAGAIVVKTDRAHYTFKLSAPLDFQRAVIKGMPADLARAERTVPSPENPTSENDPIPFADPIVKAICLKNWDANGDGEFSYAEAAAVTDLGTVFKENKNITSFNELQYFIGLESIGNINTPNFDGWTFHNCSNLQSIIFPPNLKAIQRHAFTGCGFKTISVPENVTNIGDNAFNSCHKLEIVYLPNHLETLSEAIFRYSPNIKEFNSRYATNDKRALIKDNILIACATNGLSEYDIPQGITRIGDAAFCFAQDLQTVYIPNTVTAIGYESFKGCSQLNNVILPSGLKEIEQAAFCGTNLTSITIPSSVTRLGAYAFDDNDNLKKFISRFASPDNRCLIINNRLVAFAYSGLIEYEIPYGVIDIECNIEWQDGNLTIPESVENINILIPNNMQSITCFRTIPPTINRAVSSSSWDVHGCILYVPKGYINAYREAEGWNKFENLNIQEIQ